MQHICMSKAGKHQNDVSKYGQKIVVEFSYPPGTDLEAVDIIEVPQTNPVLLEVSWQGEVDQHIDGHIARQGRLS